MNFNMRTKKRLPKISPVVVFLLMACLSRPGITRADDNALDYSQFKEPPAEYRGICWMDFNLSNLTEEGVVSRIQSSASAIRGDRL